LTIITTEVILIIYPVEFYIDKRGKEPVAKWLDEVFKSDAAGASKIDDRIQKLSPTSCFFSILGVNAIIIE